MNLNQLMALVRIRFQLTLNQIRKAGVANSILLTIIGVALVLFVVSSFIGTLTIGVAWLTDAETRRVMFAWNGLVVCFLFMWGINVMSRVQQNDAISIDKLLHLPITFHGAFLLNYVSSIANLTLLSFAPLMIGLAIATPLARGWPSAVAIPLTLSFLFMVTAITYQIRNWLAEKMKNKRTKGILMTVLPLLFVAVYLGLVELTKTRSFTSVLSEAGFGWLPTGIVDAESGDWFSGVRGILAMTAIGCASLFFAYKSSMRKFTGAGVRASKKNAMSSATSVNWLGSRMFTSLPGVPDSASAVALSTIQSIRRAPEVYAALVPSIALAIFGTPYLIGMKGYLIPGWAIDFLPLALISIALLGFPAFLFSTFSYDRDGFRAFMLSPVPRKDILLGKNLAIGIPTVILGWITMIILQCFIPVEPLWFIGSLICLPTSFLLLCLAGNAISVFFSLGLKRGSMTPVNTKIIPVLMLYLGILVGPLVALIPVMVVHVAVGLLERSIVWPLGWLYMLLSLLLLWVSWLVYRRSLVEFGDWLWKKESAILDTVANIPE